MPISIVIDRSAAAPLYQQIAEQIKEQIAAGKLMTGARLPTVRQLADDLGVTRLTIQSAYGELQAGGWIEATVGRGTFVSQQPRRPLRAAAGTPPTAVHVIGDILQLSESSGIRSLGKASPDPALFPAEEFWAVLGQLLPHSAELAGYGSAQGDPALRLAFAENVRERGIDATPADILITAGVTQGLALTAQSLAQPGDTVLVEQPTYIGFLHQLRSYGLNPIAVPMDDQGVQPEMLERIAIQTRARFLYTISTYHNPTGCCAPVERRRQLLEIAHRVGFKIVEDDIYAALALDAPPPPAIKSLDRNGSVVYLSSLSKSFMPGLRIGFLIAPQPLLERLTSLRMATDLVSPLLLQRTAAELLKSGCLRRHLRRVIPLYRARRDALLAALALHLPNEVTFTQPTGGLSCWLTLPRRPGLQDLPRQMVEAGWAVAPGEVLWADHDGDLHLRLSYGCCRRIR
ncbi:MAG: PLP-dependent aminotransferase family protein [Anaerolineales bacterium]|nr:PLP-dependent aminotransferase family protein [Anaerolineales bacterium]